MNMSNLTLRQENIYRASEVRKLLSDLSTEQSIQVLCEAINQVCAVHKSKFPKTSDNHHLELNFLSKTRSYIIRSFDNNNY